MSDSNGLLSATGAAVSGSGTKALTVTGSSSQVNAALATLTDTDSVAGTDTITLTALDSFGNTRADDDDCGDGEWPARGRSAGNGGGMGVGKARSRSVGSACRRRATPPAAARHFTVDGCRYQWPAVGARALGCLDRARPDADAGGHAGAGECRAWRRCRIPIAWPGPTRSRWQCGGQLRQCLCGHERGGDGERTAPARSPGDRVVAAVGKALAIKGVSLDETGYKVGETFTVALTDTNGLLSATGTRRVSGSGTKSLSVTGSLAGGGCRAWPR